MKAKPKRKQRLLAAAVTAGDRAAARKKSADLFIQRPGGRWIISSWQFGQIETALKRADPLDNSTRQHLLELIDYVAVLHLNDEAASRGGGRPKRFTRMDIVVDIVRVLHDQRGIKLAAAVSAMVREDVGTEDSRRKLRQNIERAYRASKSSARQALARATDVAEALARINPPKNRK